MNGLRVMSRCRVALEFGRGPAHFFEDAKTFVRTWVLILHSARNAPAAISQPPLRIMAEIAPSFAGHIPIADAESVRASRMKDAAARVMVEKKH
jgi:hypothetical protein